MSGQQKTPASSGIGLGGAVFIVFLVLKLTHVIDWSWWWVTAPLWIPAACVVGFLAGACVVAIVVALITAAVKR